MEDTTNKQRGSFADVRRTLRVLREEAEDASWFTTRHAEVCLYLWDYQTENGLEVQNLPEHLGLNQATINRILHTLGNRSSRHSLKWIEMTTDLYDRRKRRVFFTDRGKFVMNRLANADENTKAVDHYLEANDIVMKAEVGNVEVRMLPAELKVTRAMEAKEALRLETNKQVKRIMHKGETRWAIYDIDDFDLSKPIAFQKDTPKEHVNLIADGLVKQTVSWVKAGLGKEHWDLEQSLEGLMATMNRDEYYRLRGMVMEGIAIAIKQVRKDAAVAASTALKHSEQAGELLNRVGKMPDTQMNERMEMFGAAKDEIGKAAEAEKVKHKAEVEGDQMGQLMAMMMRQQETIETLTKEVTDLRKGSYGSGGYGKGAYGGTEVEEDDE